MTAKYFAVSTAKWLHIKQRTETILKQVNTTLLIIYFLIQRRGKLNFQKVRKLQNLKLFVLSSWNLRGNYTLEIVSEAANQKLR